MTMFTVSFFTGADWAEKSVRAATPQRALQRALLLADEDLVELDFQSYDDCNGVEQIQVFDASWRPVAEWRSPDLLVRLAAPKLLAALRQAVAALNTAPRFAVPSLDSDSYDIAAACDRVIRQAETGAT